MSMPCHLTNTTMLVGMQRLLAWNGTAPQCPGYAGGVGFYTSTLAVCPAATAIAGTTNHKYA